MFLSRLLRFDVNEAFGHGAMLAPRILLNNRRPNWNGMTATSATNQSANNETVSRSLALNRNIDSRQEVPHDPFPVVELVVDTVRFATVIWSSAIPSAPLKRNCRKGAMSL